MTDTVKVLSDDALREIEAWKTNSYGSMVNLPVAKRDALCATVRTLRQQNQELKAIVDIGTSDDPGTALAKVHRIQDEATTALRQQLARHQETLTALRNCQNKPACGHCAALLRAATKE